MSDNKKKLITSVIVIIISILFIFIGNSMCPYEKSKSDELNLIKAKVTEILDVKESLYSLDSSATKKEITFNAKITSGEHKGEIITMTETIDGFILPKPREVKKGDHILCTYFDETEIMGGESGWVYISHNRSTILTVLVIGFFALIILIGKRKGVSTLISLIITLAVIFWVFIPSILFGKNIYFSTIIIGVFIILMSIILLNGINKKSLCAILGNLGGLAISGILALIMNKILAITGMVDENYTYLSLLDNGVSIDLKAVVWSGIVIGSLGAVMDVAMSLASSMNELSENMHEKSYIKMVKSGMNIGRDAIGTMTNTLILAYVGSSLATILLLVSYNKNLLYLVNMEMITVEILQAIVGSIGILFAVPVTVLFSAKIFNKKEDNKLSDKGE